MRYFLVFFVSVSSLLADISGHVKGFGIYRHKNSLLDSNTSFYGSLRINLFEDFKGEHKGEVTYELVPVAMQRKTISLFPFYVNSTYPYRIADLEAKISSSPHFELFQNLDRVYLSLSLPSVDLTIGRQPIAFGVSRAVNPTDIILPFPFYAIDTENRIGVDAVRFIVSITDLSQVDFGFVGGQHLDIQKDLAFLKASFNINKTDISPLIIYFQENVLVGINVERPILEAGFWLEAAYVFTKPASDRYFSLSSGIDYTFTEDIYFFMEYHYNGAGSSDKDDYFSVVNQVAYTKGGIYLLGKHYLIPALNYNITPLIDLSVLLLWNLSDLSLSFDTDFKYNLSENTYLNFNVLLGVGRRLSEFRIFPSRCFLSFSYYF